MVTLRFKKHERKIPLNYKNKNKTKSIRLFWGDKPYQNFKNNKRTLFE